MNSETDTIAAIATAPGEGGVAVVRVSGPESLRIADTIFRSSGPAPSARPSHTVTLGRVVDAAGRTLDEVLLLVMKSPHSYTGEDVVEFQGHGGRIVSENILQRTISAGARTAEPGEFTKRAFLHGKIDMIQAESVLDLVRAQSDMSARHAVEQLQGRLSRDVEAIYEKLMGVSAELEASLDFPEDELPETLYQESHKSILKSVEWMDRLLDTWQEGRVLREGLRMVISGRPNAGKSTLFNLLLGVDRAIVSRHPGTTRDTIEEPIAIRGVPVRLVDTAGLRESECEIEREGVRRAHAATETADVTLYVLDGSSPLGAEETARLKKMDPRRTLLIVSKTDIHAGPPVEIPSFINEKTIAILTQKSSRQLVIDSISKLISKEFCVSSEHAVSVSARHREALVLARGEAAAAAAWAPPAPPPDPALVCSHLRGAIDELGRLTGRIYTEELLDQIFSRFCIGK